MPGKETTRESDRPRVSVVMAVYNGASYVEEAIESVTGQSLGDFELIVIDDGSSDRTWEILGEWRAKDERVVPVRNERNVGLSGSLNRGIALARGEYIARQDADDVSEELRLETQVEFLEQHVDVGIVGSAYTVVDERGRRVESHHPPTGDAEIRWEMLFHNAFCHSSVMLRRRVLNGEAAEYDAALPYAQDYDLWARLLRRTRGANLDTPMVALRAHPESTTARCREQQQSIASMISAREIARSAPAVSLSSGEVDTLRRWYNAFPGEVDSGGALLCGKLSRVLEAFVEQDNVDRVAGDEIRRRWGERIMRALEGRSGAAASTAVSSGG